MLSKNIAGLFITCLSLLTLSASADNADILKVNIEKLDGRNFRIDATVRHHDEGGSTMQTHGKSIRWRERCSMNVFCTIRMLMKCLLRDPRLFPFRRQLMQSWYAPKIMYISRRALKNVLLCPNNCNQYLSIEV